MSIPIDWIFLVLLASNEQKQFGKGGQASKLTPKDETTTGLEFDCVRVRTLQ